MTRTIDLFCGVGGIACAFDEDRMMMALGFVTPDGHADRMAYFAWKTQNAIQRAEAMLKYRFCEGMWDDIRIRIERYQEKMRSIILRMREAWDLIRGGGIMGNGKIETIPEVLPLPPTGVVMDVYK